jgi:hypothetical protein
MVLLSGLAAVAFSQDKKPEGLQKDWESVQPFEFETKKKELKPETKIGKQSITLRNRGMVTTKKEYNKDEKGKTVVSLTWKWVKGEGNTYDDHLALVLRTDGTQRQKRSWEAENGILVKFTPGQVILAQIKGDYHEGLATATIGVTLGEENQIRVTDDGQQVEVYFGTGKDPIISKQVGRINDLTDRKISLYNREPVAGVEHESYLTNVKIEIVKQ